MKLPALATARLWLLMLLPFVLWGTAMTAMAPLLETGGGWFVAGLRLLPAHAADLAGKAIGGKQIRLQFAVSTKAKTPVLELHEVEFDARRLERSKVVFSRVWDAIKAGNVFPVPSQMNCWGCPYTRACKAWSG